MKLRIRDNSLRLRLTKGEVATLGRDGRVAATTSFPEGRTLTYAVESTPASVVPTAAFADRDITVRLPEAAVLPWTTSEQVAIAADQQLEDGSVLSLLVEKDFACLAPRAGEDESDMYPHPDAGQERC